MTGSRVDTVVTGQVVVEARPDGLETAEAVAIAEGRVVATGSREEMLSAAPRWRLGDPRRRRGGGAGPA